MPRAGIAYHIDAAWRTRAVAELTARGWNKARLAKESGAPRSLITELLAGTRSQTTYLPELHGAFGWPPPAPPIASPDTGEISYIFDRLDEVGRERLITKAREELDRILRPVPPTAGTAKKKS